MGESFGVNSLLRLDIKASLSAKENEIFEILLKASKRSRTTVRIAGGWVRDKLLGLENHDIDVALDNISGFEFAEETKKKRFELFFICCQLTHFLFNAMII